jgi:hypothetical protein
MPSSLSLPYLEAVFRRIKKSGTDFSRKVASNTGRKTGLKIPAISKDH